MLTHLLSAALATILLAGCSALAGPGGLQAVVPSTPPSSIAAPASLSPIARTEEPVLASQVPVVAADARSQCLALDVPTLLPMPDGTSLAAAFSTSADKVDAWRVKLAHSIGVVVESPRKSPAAQIAGTSDWFVCYFDGDFGRQRGDTEGTEPRYSRIVVVIDGEGLPDIAGMGYIDGLPVVDPNEE